MDSFWNGSNRRVIGATQWVPHARGSDHCAVTCWRPSTALLDCHQHGEGHWRSSSNSQYSPGWTFWWNDELFPTTIWQIGGVVGKAPQNRLTISPRIWDWAYSKAEEDVQVHLVFLPVLVLAITAAPLQSGQSFARNYISSATAVDREIGSGIGPGYVPEPLRVGEARHPGPELEMDHLLTAGISKPGGVRNKEDLILALGPGLWTMTETQLSSVTRIFKAGGRKMDKCLVRALGLWMGW